MYRCTSRHHNVVYCLCYAVALTGGYFLGYVMMTNVCARQFRQLFPDSKLMQPIPADDKSWVLITFVDSDVTVWTARICRVEAITHVMRDRNWPMARQVHECASVRWWVRLRAAAAAATTGEQPAAATRPAQWPAGTFHGRLPRSTWHAGLGRDTSTTAR